MVVVGLTSGIGCGKSTVAGIFRKQGVKVIDADRIVSSLRKKTCVKRKLREEFGTVNKKKIAEIVFSSKRKLKKLNSIFHPPVKKEIKKRIRNLKKRKLIVFEVPLLFEAKMQGMFDFVVVVKCSRRQQIKRAGKKLKISRKEVLKRIGAQMSLREKVKRADYVIDNSRGKSFVRRQVLEILEVLG